jgi:N6-L-threonylcarbamoyladenine synthase
MKILGIESTAHTFGIGIIDDKGKELANNKDTFKPKEGGFLPRQAAEHHYNIADDLLLKALNKANITLKDIDLIAFSQSPGIGQTLEVGALMARYLSLKYNKPIIGVNHCIAHIEIGKLKTNHLLHKAA